MTQFLQSLPCQTRTQFLESLEDLDDQDNWTPMDNGGAEHLEIKIYNEQQLFKVKYAASRWDI